MNPDEEIVQRARENAQRTLEQIRPAFADLQGAVGIIMQSAVADAQRTAQPFWDAISRMSTTVHPSIFDSFAHMKADHDKFLKMLSQSTTPEIRALPIPKPPVPHSEYDAAVSEIALLRQKVQDLQKALERQSSQVQPHCESCNKLRKELFFRDIDMDEEYRWPDDSSPTPPSNN